MEKDYLEITGEIEDIIYRNEENGYTVIELYGEEESITAVGVMPLVNIGEEVVLIGFFKNHSNYGRQFQAVSCERKMPTSVMGIYKYLASGALKGIGPSFAQKLVSEFKENTLEVIENEPERVAKFKGISLKKAQDMSEQIKKVKDIRRLMSYLEQFAVSPAQIVAVWKKFGSLSLQMIKENPYLMCDDSIGVPFSVADAISEKQDEPVDLTCRIRAGIVHILTHNKRNGHTCLPCDKLTLTASDFLSVSPDDISKTLDEMVIDNTLISDSVNERKFIFLPQMYKAETYIASRVNMLLRFPAVRIPNVEQQIEKFEKRYDITYAELQKEGIRQALNTGLLILTGGPGTGKTTTLNAVINILKENNQKVLLAAPTGRAAKRMSELTGDEAKTIHRLLEVSWDKDDNPVFKRNEQNLLKCDAIVIDEMSMVDVSLFESVMRALPLGCRLVLVGDTDQLPSVGPGNVLDDLIASGTMPVVSLKEIFRQSMQSLIVTNAHKIVKGEMPNLTDRTNDFFFLPQTDKGSMERLIVDLYKTRLPKTYGYSPINDIQVLSPARKGVLGTYELNNILQSAINPPSNEKKEVKVNMFVLREGDKVMQVKNNYDIVWVKDDGEQGSGIYNGDIGVLESVNKATHNLKIRFDDRIAVYDMDSMYDLELAYAATVHKSQGNEFDAVIIPMFRCAPRLAYRNLLYTAVTRAKKILILVGDKSCVSAMVQNNRQMLRYSGLKTFLTECCKNE